MGDYNKDSKQDKFMDFLLQEFPGCSDEELLDEYEAACNLDIPLPNPEPSPEQFERIWSRIQAERADIADSEETEESVESGHGKVIKVIFGWKRLAAVGLIACLMAGSGCIVAMGTKSYFYRERVRENSGNNVIYNNDMNKIATNGEEDAYNLIEQELNIKPLKLGYIPKNMEFLSVKVEKGYASMDFLYQKNHIFLVQSKYNKKVSFNYESDSDDKNTIKVFNKWLGTDLYIKKEILTNESASYEIFIVTEGICYRLKGIMDEEIFIKIAEELSF